MYADYKFYTERFGGKLTEEEFASCEPKAEAYIRYFLFTNGSVLDKEPVAGVQMAVCAVADVIGEYYSQQESRAASGGSGAAVKSESNDGYSVSYAVEQTDGETAEIFLRKKAYDAAYLYLLPLGLLCRKVVYPCDHECGCDCL